jgi:hypothetical protein
LIASIRIRARCPHPAPAAVVGAVPKCGRDPGEAQARRVVSSTAAATPIVVVSPSLNASRRAALRAVPGWHAATVTKAAVRKESPAHPSRRSAKAQRGRLLLRDHIPVRRRHIEATTMGSPPS